MCKSVKVLSVFARAATSSVLAAFLLSEALINRSGNVGENRQLCLLLRVLEERGGGGEES